MFSKVFIITTLVGIAVASLPQIVVDVKAPQPYKFGYDIKDKHGEQYRQEEGNGGNAVKGSYGFTDDRGVKRQVDYVADHAGFRAQVKTNEPGTANQNPAAVQMISNAPYAGGLLLGGLGYGNGGLSYGNGGLGYGNSVLGYGNGGLSYGNGELGYGNSVLGYGNGGLSYGNGALGYGNSVLGYGNGGLSYGNGGLGYGNGVLGYGGNGLGYNNNGYTGAGYGLGNGIGGLGYARYGY